MQMHFATKPRAFSVYYEEEIISMKKSKKKKTVEKIYHFFRNFCR